MRYKKMTLDSHDAWLQARMSGIGASESAALFAASRYKSPLGLWTEKIGLAEPVVESEAMEWGSRLEPLIAVKYAQETGRDLDDLGRHTILQSTDTPCMLATLDRVIKSKDGDGVLEIKTAGERSRADWDEGVPLHYQIQVQHQLAVTGYSWGSVAVLIGGQTFKWIDVERNDKFIAVLRQRCADFWGLVESREPPAVDDSDATSAALKCLYPTDDGSTIHLPAEAIAWDDELTQIRMQIAALSDRERALKNKLIAALGSATTGVIRDGLQYTYKTTTKAEHVVKATSYRTLRRSEK